MDSKAPAPAGGGGGTKKKRNRKKGAANSKSDGAPKDNAAQAAPSTAAAGRGGKSKKRRGGGRGGGGGGGGGGGESSNRFNKTAPSPLQLPHVKVTIRNIVDVNKHGTIEGIINSVKGFLEGAFPSTSSRSSSSSTHQTSKSGTANGGDNEYNPYTMAWHLEKDEFDSAKNMFADVATAAASSDANKSTANGSASGASSSTAATRAFSSGWVYDEKCLPHPITGHTVNTNTAHNLPTCDSIVTKLLSNQTDKRISPTANTNWIVDTAMSQMMGECSKEYLNLVGGQVMLDEESCLDVTLAEMVREERQKRLEREEKQRLEREQEEKEKDENDCQMDEADKLAAAAAAETNISGEKKDKATSVDSVTKDLSKLSTTSETTTVKKQPTSSASQPPPSPTIRIRLLSITPVKTSKRRGEIGGKVTLALYPPDPCLLFKESFYHWMMNIKDIFEKIDFS